MSTLAPFALVTGASAGLGYATARALLDRGWQVLGVSRRAAGIDHPLYADLRCDLSAVDALGDTFDADWSEGWALADRPRLGLVNNAAVLGPTGPFIDLDPVAMHRALGLNVVAPAWLTARFVRWAGEVPLRVVNISSGAAHKPYAGWATYCASKGALHQLGGTFGNELEDMPALDGRDVQIVGFAPGVVDTDMQAQIREHPPRELPMVKRFLDLKANGELLPPEMPAAAIADLLERDDLPPFHETRYPG